MDAVTLPAGLILRSVQDEEDIQRFVSFNANCNNPFEGATCNCLLRHHPSILREEFWIVQDQQTGQVVSTTCLIPWECVHAGIHLRLAMLEMVLTHPDYRGRGLVRVQIEHFHRQILRRGFDLSVIGGIPYYYRQFGYAYTMHGGWFESLPAWRIPDAENGDYSVRSANGDDIPHLAQIYQHEMHHLDSFIDRTASYWKYLLGHANHPIWLVVNLQSGKPAGYLEIVQIGDQLNIYESGFYSAEAGVFALGWLKKGFDKEIRFFGSRNGVLVDLVRGLGSQTFQAGQWLVRIPELRAFLTKIGPALENRLAGTAWSDLNRELTINIFREACRLRFEKGKLTAVDSLGFVDSSMGADGGDLCIPPDAFTRLVTGFQTIDQLFDAWPDIVVKPTSRALLDTLFPKMDGYWNFPYHFVGSIENKESPNALHSSRHI